MRKKEDDTKIEEVPTPEIEEAAKSELGKIYKLGKHMLMCGDSTKAEDVFTLMEGRQRRLFIQTRLTACHITQTRKAQFRTTKL